MEVALRPGGDDSDDDDDEEDSDFEPLAKRARRAAPARRRAAQRKGATRPDYREPPAEEMSAASGSGSGGPPPDHKCDECEFACHDAATLERHHRGRHLACQRCPHVSGDRAGADEHVLEAHPDSLMCSLCCQRLGNHRVIQEIFWQKRLLLASAWLLD